MKTPHLPLRSSMSNFDNIVLDRRPYGMRDILRSKKIREIREEKKEIVREEIRIAKEKLFGSGSGIRFTIAKRIKGGFHCTGIGNVSVSSFDELKKFVKGFSNAEGKKFNKIRMGCVVASV